MQREANWAQGLPAAVCRAWLVGLATAAFWQAANWPAQAAGRVQLELVTEKRVPITAQQQWLRRLAQAGISHLRIRIKRPADKPAIVVRGTQAAPVYTVTGIITSGGDLLLPGQRFEPRDLARLARWLDDLARLGPPDQRPQKSVFGLSVEQFKEVHKALSLPVQFSTKGARRSELVKKIRSRVPLPFRLGPELDRAMEEDDLVAEELSGLSCGTVLAYLLRPLGWALIPRQSAGRLECVLAEARPNAQVWPVGWAPEKHRQQILPALFEFLNVNVQAVPVSQLLDVVGQRLQVPVLWDHNALARQGIQPDKALVNFPQKRTTYSLLLRRCLYQAGLTSELRVDEAGKPFLWVTTIRQK